MKKKGKTMDWKNVKNLPLNECGVKKLVILTHGRLNSNTIFPCMGSWLVQKADGWEVESDDAVMVNDEGYYGKLNLADDWFPLNKVLAWCYADEIVEDYERRREKEEVD